MRERRKLRIVNYAVNGRGVGHLTRLTAINRWLRRYAAYCGVRAEIYFLTSSEADGLLFQEGFASFKLPSKTVVKETAIHKQTYLALAKQWVWHSLGLLRPDLLIVDTFPRGSFGELLSALDLAKHKAFVYRPLKASYAARPDFQAMLPLYDAILVPDYEEHAPGLAPPRVRQRIEHVGPVVCRERVELLARDEARGQLGVGQQLCVYVSAGGGGDPTSEGALTRVLDALAGQEGLHLVIGAGPLYRGRRQHGPGVTWLGHQRAIELMPAFDLAISAGGYNSFFELMHVGVPALFLPQDKVADEQDVRAERAVAAGAARLLPAPSGDADADRAAIRAAVDALRDPEERAALSAAARALVPRNHAREAAAELLRLALPPAAVEAAEEAIDDALLAEARQSGLELDTFFEVMEVLDPRPREELDAEAASEASQQALELLRHVGRLGVPLPAARRVIDPLARKLVSADPVARAELARGALDAFAPFADWAGAAMVVRTLRNERELEGEGLARALGRFLAVLRDEGQTLYQGLERLGAVQGVEEDLPTNRELLARASAPAVTSEGGA